MISCLDIGGSGIKGAIVREGGAVELLGRVKTPLKDFDAFAEAVREMLAVGPAASETPVAISITGVVDPRTGIITCANIPAIDGLRLAAELGERLKRRVVVGNDADCFALAEAVMGAGKGHRIVFGAILGTGVGGGLVIDGRLVNGAGGYAGEWGHAPIAATRVGSPAVEIPRFRCGCGQMGCLDTVGAARGLERLHRHFTGEAIDSIEIVAAWQAGERSAARTVEYFLEIVAAPLALVVNVVGADIVPVGGGLGKSAPLMARLDEEVRGRILRRMEERLVVQSAIAVDAGLIGAAILGGLK